MLHPPDEAAARDPIVRARGRNVLESNASNPRNIWRFWSGACFVIFLLAAFGRPLRGLANYAAHSSLHSYILLIPFVSGYLLYLRRNELPKNRVADFPLGVLSLACGLGLFLLPFWWLPAGRASADNTYFVLLTISFLCCLAAGVFLFFGREWVRAAAFPLAYLVFMIPMPDVMADALETGSQYASAEVANVFFQLSGTPILRAGRVFQLPNITIEVAQECSGIRSSWVLLMTSVLAANLFLKTSWRRVVLLAFIIPLGILRNGFRILVIGLLCVNVGPQMIHSPIHTQGGPVFFVLSLIPLLLLLWWLRKGEMRTRPVE
jgi:exosortase C (VPDSG-CTERM-specific)